MEFVVRRCLFMFMCILAASATSSCSVSSSSTCPLDFRTFLHDLNSQCPVSSPGCSSPIQVDSELFERTMSSIGMNEYTAALFYASWCPFSSIFQSKFSILTSMYPHIKHQMIEQSSVLPTVFSQYGIHSVPSLLIWNHTKLTRYHGPKDLSSLVNFYKRTTGLDPVVDIVEDTKCNLKNDGGEVFHVSNRASLKEIFSREPYLVLSFIFVLSRALVYFLPEIASRLVAIWVTYIPHPNMGIFGESRQFIGRVLHLIDAERIWSKLKLCKKRSFREGAKNAGVWASSLASMSLGESSSSRLFPSRDL